MAVKLDSPNYTQIPNIILGNIEPGNKVAPGLMEQLHGSELKVLLAICRLTFGFHQSERRASISMIEKMTGLSRQGVFNAANKLEDKYGLIERKKDGGVTLWKVVVNSVDQLLCEPVVNSVDQLVNSVDQTSQLSLPPSKKETKKKPKKKDSGADAPRPKKVLMATFQTITGLKFPHKKNDQGFWWSNIAEIFKIADESPEQADKLIREAVAKLKADNLTIGGPESIIKTCRAIDAQQRNGANNDISLSEEKLARYRELEQSGTVEATGT